PEERRAESRVDPGIVEKRAPISHPQDRLREGLRRPGQELRQPERARVGSGLRVENALLADEPPQERRIEMELACAGGEKAALLDRIVEAPPAVGHATLLSRSDLSKRALRRGSGGREAPEREVGFRDPQLAPARSRQHPRLGGRVLEHPQPQELVGSKALGALERGVRNL